MIVDRIQFTVVSGYGNLPKAANMMAEDTVPLAMARAFKRATGPLAERVKEAWLEEQTPQCGYCQPGQVIAATVLLEQNPKPRDADIDEAMSQVLCRCGSYPAIRRAIHRAAGSK